MVDENTDFFKIEDNFAKTAHIPSIPIIESKLDFVPKVTIAIPTYKRAALLKEALDSAINQIGFDEYDIIVVDNNPERGCETEKLMLTYHEPRLSYYKNAENLGMVGNLNRCIALAKGEYLTILHDDDALHYNFIAYFQRCLVVKPDLKCFVCSMYNVGADVKFEDIGFNSKLKKVNKKVFLFGNITPFPGVVFQNDKNISFDESTYPIMDLDFWYRLSLKGNFYISAMKLAFYRISEQQTSNTVYKQIIDDTKKFHHKYLIGSLNPFDQIVSNYSIRNLENYYMKVYINRNTTKINLISIINFLIYRIYKKIIFI